MEQITYPLFMRRLDELHTLEERKATRLGKPTERPVFPKGAEPKGRAYSDLRWSHFKGFEPRDRYTAVGARDRGAARRAGRHSDGETRNAADRGPAGR